MKYKAMVRISLKEGMTDPEGNATSDSLKNLGFNIQYVKKSSVFEVGGVDAKNRTEALGKVDEMCKKLLSNPVKDYYKIAVKEM